MSTETQPQDTAAETEKTGNARAWMVFYATAVVVANLVKWSTGWPWWAFAAPAAGITAVALAYHWAKNRRREAEAADAR